MVPNVDGVEAIEKYEETMASDNPFLAVILDLTVPGGMGGRETINKLIGIDPNINAIICSGYSNDPIMSEYEKFGFKGVIKKPYTIEDLISTLDSIMV